MEIFLVEAGGPERERRASELTQRGYSVAAAADATAAHAALDCALPVVLIVDVSDPGVDGLACLRAIHECGADNWLPVIALADRHDDGLQLEAMRLGVDVLLMRPVSAEMLDLRLRSIQRRLDARRQAGQRATELERYYSVEEEEKRIARQLVDRLISAEKLADPAIRYWLSPAADFSGDVFAAARTPGGTLHLMLADGAGHSLTASISTLPIVPPFYSMTDKGFGIDAIARELNGKIRRLLPVDRFVALALVAVDFREGLVHVWNGGTPGPLLLRVDSGASREFALRHAPMGVLDDEAFDEGLESHAFVEKTQLLLYSDGLLKAENAAGAAFGASSLHEAIAAAAAGDVLDSISVALQRHMAGAPTGDDISVLLVNCERDQEIVTRGHQRQAGRECAGSWRVVLRLGARELQRIDAVPALLSLANQFEHSEEFAGQLFVVLSEMFNNALDHGLLRLDSRLKLSGEGMEAYLRERAARLARLQDGMIEFDLERFSRSGEPWLRVACRDSGNGFDHRRVTASGSEGGLPFGRGLMLLRSICATLDFNGKGNAITATVAMSVGTRAARPGVGAIDTPSIG